MNKVNVIKNIKPSQQVRLVESTDLDAVTYDQYIIPVIEKDDLITSTQKNLKHLGQLINQVSFMNKEIQNIIKR